MKFAGKQIQKKNHAKLGNPDSKRKWYTLSYTWMLAIKVLDYLALEIVVTGGWGSDSLGRRNRQVWMDGVRGLKQED